MTAPADYPITITQDNDLVEPLVAGDGSGGLYDLTGATIEAQVWRGSIDLHAMSVDVTDAVNGEFTLGLARAVTATMVAGEWRWDFSVTSADDIRVTLISGRFKVLESRVPAP